MQEKDLEYFRAWFADYIAPFYGDDEYINANLKLKEDHTYRVCDEIVELARSLGLNERQRLIAETIALFHDLGRFPQFDKYRTFVDLKSTSHSRLSVEVLQKESVLEELSEDEVKLIHSGISLHNQKSLPADLDEQTELFAKLIRDADKIDIYYVVIKNYQEYESCPEGLVYEVDLADDGSFSPHVLEAIMQGVPVSYHDLRTLNDAKMLQLGWVFEINFDHSLKRIRQRRYLLQLMAMLPRTAEIAKLGQRVFKYLDSRLEEDDIA
jgi:hypothetical protein